MSVIPGIVQTGGMNELTELQLSESDEMKFVVDASQNLCVADSVLSKLKKKKTGTYNCG